MKGILSAGLLSTLAGLVATLAIAGCGGGEAHQAGGEAPQTKAEFLVSGNAICRRAAAEQVQLAGRYDPKRIPRPDSKAVMAVVVPPMEKEVRRLEALNPPQGGKGRILTILNAIESGLYDVRADYVDLFFKENDPFKEADRLALRFGLDACAESSHAVIKPRD